MKNQISHLLLTLGIHSTCKGFHYLHYALTLCLENEDYLLFVHKKLYAAISEKYHSSRDSVDHCIRTAVTNCWNSGNREFLCEIAHYQLPAKPSNGEFIDILYHYLKSQDD